MFQLFQQKMKAFLETEKPDVLITNASEFADYIVKWKGKVLLVVTAKQQEMAESILRYVGIDRYFRAVVGPNRSESRTDKAAMIKKALSWLELHESADSPAAEHTVMVGDRFFDIEGAVQDGVDSIGVLYGYGDRQELEEAGATWFAETPEEVVRIIKGTS